MIKGAFLPELLAPAGSFSALEAAIEAGADALYFGASDFNARMRAKNFTDEELTNALKLCSAYGVKTYVTLNTRLRDRELTDALKLAEKLYLDGVSAVITADLGLVSLIGKYIPSLELHASTQLSGHSEYDAEALKEFGFSRMVCPREMSFEEIKRLVEKSPLEIEMFIHGAHCVSFSGQCMMSWAMGGRSGNRGSCAQPCRLPYDMPSVKNRYPLSLSDMCLAGSVTDVISTGVSSLKIEGRQKSADYVYGVVSIYRKLLDERRNATSDETEKLRELFSRSGFTDGYFRHSYGKMLGMRTKDDAEASKSVASFEALRRKVPLEASLELRIGKEAALTARAGGRTVCVSGDIVAENLDGKAMSEEAARANMSRLGNTPYTLSHFSFNADDGAFCTLSQINALRRSAVEKLSEREDRKSVFAIPESIRTEKAQGKKTIYTAEFPSFSLVTKEALSYFDRIYIPLSDADKADGEKVCVSLPPLMFGGEAEQYKKVLSGLKGEVLVHGLGEALIAKEVGLAPIGSFRLNVFNSVCAAALEKYVGCVCISPEAPLGLLGSISCDSSVIVYGKVPLMHTQRCMLSDGGATCAFGGAGGRVYHARAKKKGASQDRECDGRLCRGTMKDRVGAAFPIVGLDNCTNVIYNSVPIYMADRKEVLASYPCGRYHFIFSDESEKEIDAVIRAYKNGSASDKKDIKRLK